MLIILLIIDKNCYYKYNFIKIRRMKYRFVFYKAGEEEMNRNEKAKLEKIFGRAVICSFGSNFYPGAGGAGGKPSGDTWACGV